MRRPPLRGSLGLNLLGVLLICGCRHAPPCCPDCGPSACGTSAVSAYPAPAVPAPPNGPPPTAAAGPVLHTVNKPADPSRPVIASAAPVADERRAPPFAHDAEYHHLTGTVSFSPGERAWLLRYAALGTGDRYGGVVTLADVGRKVDLRDGQVLRVEGRLIDPDSRYLRPAFSVHSLAPVGP